MRMSFDDQYLFTVSEDASLFIYKATDKEGRGLKRDKELVYAEEILITKSDLEEKVSYTIVLSKYSWYYDLLFMYWNAGYFCDHMNVITILVKLEICHRLITTITAITRDNTITTITIATTAKMISSAYVIITIYARNESPLDHYFHYHYCITINIYPQYFLYIKMLPSLIVALFPSVQGLVSAYILRTRPPKYLKKIIMTQCSL